MKSFARLQRLASASVDVQGQSMEPACPSGRRIRVNRLAYLAASPRRGDVVAVRSPVEPGRVDLKRVIGLPTEEIAWQHGRFWINGTPLTEPYAKTFTPVPGDEARGVCRLGPRHYFVAGDNRLYSQDSRVYGPVSRSAILGKILS